MKRNKEKEETTITGINLTEEKEITEEITTENKEIAKDNNTSQSMNKEENKDKNKEVKAHNLMIKYVSSEGKRSKNLKTMDLSLLVSPSPNQKTHKSKDVITRSNTAKNIILTIRQETIDQ
jgi:hypothetical protein